MASAGKLPLVADNDQKVIVIVCVGAAFTRLEISDLDTKKV